MSIFVWTKLSIVDRSYWAQHWKFFFSHAIFHFRQSEICSMIYRYAFFWLLPVLVLASELPCRPLFRNTQCLHLLLGRLFFQAKYQCCHYRPVCWERVLWSPARNPDSKSSFRSLSWWASHFSSFVVLQTSFSSALCVAADGATPATTKDQTLFSSALCLPAATGQNAPIPATTKHQEMKVLLQIYVWMYKFQSPHKYICRIRLNVFHFQFFLVNQSSKHL